MFPHIPLTIPFEVKRLWDEWNIRGAILFSLWLQAMLILVAPIRKSARTKLAVWFIWLAYLLADAAANFAVGLISNSQRNQSQSQTSKSCVGKSNTTTDNSTEPSDLLAFWAPFLLVHLGGPDTITAAALEDNQLWKRHLLSLVFQAGAVIYVFIQSLPNRNLWIPTMLMTGAGIIKYVERTRALYLASLDVFRDSMLMPPDPGPNYAKLMEEYASMKEANLPTQIKLTPEPDKETKASDVAPKKGDLNELEVVHYAYKFFEIYKGLIVDLIFSFRERDQSREFFSKEWRTAEDALRVLETELNFLYGALYTKVEVVHSYFHKIPTGHIFRCIAFASVLATLGMFYFRESKGPYSGVDVGITYTLLLGAIALDVIALLMLIFSDRTFATIKNPDRPSLWTAPFRGYLALKKARWHPCECEIMNPQTKRPVAVKHHVSITPVLFRRWSGAVSAHNLIRYSLKSKKTQIHKFRSLMDIMLDKILGLLGVKQVMEKLELVFCCRHCHCIGNTTPFIPSAAGQGKCTHFLNGVAKYLRVTKENVSQLFNSIFEKITTPVKDTVDSFMYVSSEPFTKELWDFIFTELYHKSEFADTPETARRICSARGDWVLMDTTTTSLLQNHRNTLLKYVTDVPYDQSLLLWHIATDLCYYTDAEEVEAIFRGPNPPAPPDKADKLLEQRLTHREFSKILSDYMLYLLIFQPTMMSAVAGIGKIRFLDTVAEAERFFKRRNLRPNEDDKACREILSVDTDVNPVTVKGDKSKSVLFDASILAKELSRLERSGEINKWELMSKVWVELVSYAASHVRASTHAQQVSSGGELITFFWLLMAHFGLGEQFQINEGHARAKLMVGR